MDQAMQHFQRSVSVLSQYTIKGCVSIKLFDTICVSIHIEESKDAKRTYSIEACTAKMDWPCHKNA